MDIMKNIKNVFCPEERWIAINKIEYSDMESHPRTAVGYLVSGQKLSWFQTTLENEQNDPFMCCFEDLYIRELYWSPAYQYIQRKARVESGLPDEIEKVSEEYIWDIGDGSRIEFISFSILSRYLLEKLDLEIIAGSMNLFKNGDVVVKSVYEETTVYCYNKGNKETKGLFEKSEAFFVTFWHFHLYYQ